MTKKFLLTLIFTSCLKDVSSSFMIEQEKIKSKDSTETVKNNIITKNSNDFSNQNYYTSNSDKIDDTKKKKKKSKKAADEKKKEKEVNEENEENEEEKEFFIQKIIEFYNFFGFLKKKILIIFEENTAKNGSNVFCRQSKNSSFSKYKRPSGQDYNKIIICDDINELSNKCVYVMKRINCILKKYYSSVELKNIYISLSKDAKDITTEFEHLYKNLKINDTDDMFNKLRIYLSKITQEYSISSELEESSEDSDIQDYNKKNSNEIDELSKEFDEHLEKLLKLYLDESSFIGKKKLDIFLKEKRCKIFLLINVFFKKISELEIEQKKIQYTYFINIIEHYFSEVETYLKNSKYNLEDPTPEYLDRNEKKIIKYKEEEQREEVNKSLVEEVEKYLKKKKTNNFTTSSDEDEDEDEDENTNTERPI